MSIKINQNYKKENTKQERERDREPVNGKKKVKYFSHPIFLQNAACIVLPKISE